MSGSKVVLGQTGLTVSRLCLGTLTMGPLQAGLSPEVGGEIVAEAVSRGVNFFDTAQLYGTYPHIYEGLRQSGFPDVVISTKTYAHTRQLADEAVEEARRSLDRDVIDIFLLHEQESVYTMQGHHEALETLLERKAKGIIRAVGLSTHHIAGVYAATLSGLDVVHPMFNIDGYGILDGGATQMAEAIETADRAGLGVFAMKALGGGNLFARAQECLRFVLNNPHIHAVALGCKSKEEVRANARFFETGKFLDHELGNLLTAQKHLHVADWCEGCGKCAAFCPHKAINIRDNQADVNPDKCVLCGYCGAKCPLFAIKIY